MLLFFHFISKQNELSDIFFVSACYVVVLYLLRDPFISVMFSHWPNLVVPGSCAASCSCEKFAT